jgi:hypothetical protein
VLGHRTSYSIDLYLTESHRRIIWSPTSSKLSTHRITINPSHGHPHPSQGYTSFHLKRHTHLMGIWAHNPHTWAHNQCYKNRTGTGKTGRSDRFQTQTGSNRPHEPLLTGSVRNRFFSLNRPVPYGTGFFAKEARGRKSKVIFYFFF